MRRSYAGLPAAVALALVVGYANADVLCISKAGKSRLGEYCKPKEQTVNLGGVTGQSTSLDALNERLTIIQKMVASIEGMLLKLSDAILGPSKGALGPAFSWNLSRDMMRNNVATNPFGKQSNWTAMYDMEGTSHNPSNYAPLSTLRSLSNGNYMAWGHSSIPWLNVGVPVNDDAYYEEGLPTVSPATRESAIVQWVSPIAGVVNIAISLKDLEWSCGDGVDWFVDLEDSTLLEGNIPNGDFGESSYKTRVNLEAGSRLYFIVSPREDNNCDWTSLDVLITSP